MAFGYEASDLEAVVISLSTDRFDKYLRQAKGNPRNALALYERNTSLSEGLYGVVQSAEISLRNSIHSTLTTQVGPMWFDKITFDEAQAKQIAEAKFELTEANRPISPGGIVASLRLGFWTSLISPKHEQRFWRPYLFRSFPNAWKEMDDGRGGTVKIGIKRAEISQKLESLRQMRNRIAHHEPIFHLNLWDFYVDTLKLIGWICPITASWTSHSNSFRTRFHARPESPKQLSSAPQANPVPGKPRPGR